MRKTLLSVAALLAISASADAQFYYRVGLGYALPHAGQTMAGNEWPYSGSYNNSSFAYSLNSASFSAGLQGYLGLGYDINEHVGVQLDAQAGLSSRQFDFSISNLSVGSVPSNVTVSQHADFPFYLIPSMVVKTGGDPWNIYCRMGAVLPLHSTIEKQNVIVNQPGTGALTRKVETWAVHSSFSAGLTGAAGFEYKLNPSMSLWAEVSMLSMSLYVKDAQLTAYNYNGQNINLNQLSGTLNVNYSKNVSLDTANGTRQPAYSQPFSNVGFNIGIRQTLGGPKAKNKKYVDQDTDNNGYYRKRGTR